MRVPKEKLEEILDMCRKLDKLGRLKCLDCRRRLHYKDVRYYEHGEGCYWVYLQCPYCGYGTALWKLFKHLRRYQQSEEALGLLER